MHYEIYGNGPPLILLHGLSYQGAFWWLQVKDFAPHYHVIVPDNRGAGYTDAPDEAYSTEQMADDTVQLLRALGIPRAHVLGVSLGGAIAQHIALRHPNVVDRLVLTNTLCQPSPYGHEMLATWRLIAEQAGTDVWKRVMLVQFVTPQFYSTHPDRVAKMHELAISPAASLVGFLRQNWACVHHDTAAHLSRITAPTLVLVAEQDQIIPVGSMKFIHRQIRDSQFVVLPRCKHGFMWEFPELFNEAVLQFLGS
jgi:pimeloyl-ACP methyl ester carboxylesterase